MKKKYIFLFLGILLLSIFSVQTIFAAFQWPTSQHYPSAKVGYYLFSTYPAAEGKNAYATWVAQHYDFVASANNNVDTLKAVNPNIITTSYRWFHTFTEGFDAGDFAEPNDYSKAYNFAYSNNLDVEDWFLHYKNNSITGYKASDYTNTPDDKFKYVYVGTTKKTDQAYGTSNTFAFGQSVGSILYIGHSFKFKEINFVFSTPGIGWQGIWEYWNGNSWQPLTITSDTTSGMSQNGKVEFWQPPADWKLGVVNNLAPSYFVRLRTTNIGTRYPTAQTVKHQKIYGTAVYNSITYLTFPGWDPSQDQGQNGRVANDGVRDTPQDSMSNLMGSSALFRAWSRPVAYIAGASQTDGWSGYFYYSMNNNNPDFQDFVVDDFVTGVTVPELGNTLPFDGIFFDGIDANDWSFIFGFPPGGLSSVSIIEFPTNKSGMATYGLTQTLQKARIAADSISKLSGGNPTYHAVNLDIERALHFSLREFIYGIWGVHRTSYELENSPYWQLFNSNTYHRIMAKEGNRASLNFNLGFGSSSESAVLSTLLTSDLTTTSTTINVQSTSIFPNSGSLWIGTEKIRYTSKTATSFTGATRGIDGTIAQTHTVANSAYERVMPSATMDREKIYSLSLFYLIQNPATDYFFLWKACCPQAYYTDFNSEARVFFVNAITYNIGQPTNKVPAGYANLSNNDWGVFVLATGTDFKVYGRDYSRAIVIAKPKVSAGFEDASKTIVNLPAGDRYYELYENASLNMTPITSIGLRGVEGAILIKESALNLQVCTDGTLYNSCSTTKPLYCNSAGTLVSDCTTCGCNAGQICDSVLKTCYTPVQPCTLTSAIITKNCAGGSSSDCETGETISLSGTYTGDCSSGNLLQIDARSTDLTCVLEYTGKDMNGIFSAVTPNSGIFSGSWTIPAIPTKCQGKTINAIYGGLWNGLPGVGTRLNGTNAAGTFKFYTPAPSTCSDGTLFSQCSTVKPLYCNNGILENKCTICGCSAGQTCNTATELCYIPTTCQENWVCTKWSKCNEVQTRTCTDTNNCGTTDNKPEESKACGKYKKVTISGTIQTTSGICSGCEVTTSFLDATSSATTDSSGNFALTLEPSAEFEAQSYVINGTVNKAGKIYNFRRTIKVE